MAKAKSDQGGGCGLWGTILVGVALCAVVGCVVIFLMMPSSSSQEETSESESEPVVQATIAPRPTSTPVAIPSPRPTQPEAAPSGDEREWLVMIYQDADDEVLERDMYMDLNEMERAGSSDQVHIVVQMDRYQGAFDGDGDWTSAKRFYITSDSNLDRVQSKLVKDLGEVNMADRDTLVDFATWAIQTYPARKHVLILSDHGAGWPGGWSDPDPEGQGRHKIELAENGDELFLMELDEALEQIRAKTGLERFDLIGMDACLMAHIEVFNALAPHARYAVASQETEPTLGWAYTAFLNALQNNPSMDGADLARAIVQSYIHQDQRILDDDARAEFVSDMSILGPFYTMLFGVDDPEQLAQDLGKDVTLSAVDLAAIPALTNALNDWAFALTQADQNMVAQARTYAQSFTSIFGEDVPPSYIDLGHFAQLLKEKSRSHEIDSTADALMAALQQAIVDERHGSEKPGASGISIYFPNSELYEIPAAGPESYTTVAHRFAANSLWDDFLVFHYTGRTFERDAGQVAVPASDAQVVAPGAGEIKLAPLTLSDQTANQDQPVILETEARGDKIGFIYLFVGYYDSDANSIMVADQDFIEGDATRQVDGVYYPDWGDSGVVPISFEWAPTLYAISDGENVEIALLKPHEYGRTAKGATYTVEGKYTSARSGRSRRALLYFKDGKLIQVYGFTGQGQQGSPREITPKAGDTFTILENWIDMNSSGEALETTQEGGVLTFGEDGLTWQEVDAPPGEYMIGFIVEDLDGNAYDVYEMLTVE